MNTTTGVLTLDEVVNNTSDLPALPAAALAVMRESQEATATATTIAKYLSQDQALTVRVLRLANSAYYGMSRQIGDVQDAVIVLGMRSVRNLAMVASTYHWMSKALKGYEMEPNQFWEHSLSAAVASQMLASKLQPADADIAFTCGLLHDLGKVALSAWLENRSASMIAMAAKLDLTIEQTERRVLGFDHQEVGARMGEIWNLPKALVDSMRYHHRPSDTDQRIVDIVHIADYLTMISGVGHGGDGVRYEFCPDALGRLGLSEEDLEPLSAEFCEVFEKYEKLFEQREAA